MCPELASHRSNVPVLGSTYIKHAIYETPDTSGSIGGAMAKGVKRTLLTATLAFAIPSQGVAALTPTFDYGYIQTDDHPGLQEKATIESIRGYDFAESHVVGINKYFVNYPLAHAFVAGMSRILDTVYGNEGTGKELRLLDNPDTGQPLLQLVFWSGLPIDEEFIEKDRKLFDKIVEEGLADGLRYVVFSNS